MTVKNCSLDIYAKKDSVLLNFHYTWQCVPPGYPVCSAEKLTRCKMADGRKARSFRTPDRTNISHNTTYALKMKIHCTIILPRGYECETSTLTLKGNVR